MSIVSASQTGRSTIKVKSIKLARFPIDILAVFKSEDSTPIPMTDALTALKEKLSSKKPPKIDKCIMQIWHKHADSFNFIIKSKDKNKNLETFPIDSVGVPTCSEIGISRQTPQSLVFLPVLNKDNIAELFIFHPYQISAQEIVIKIAKLLENKKKVDPYNLQTNVRINGNPQPENHNRPNNSERIEKTKEDDVLSLASISSNFLNNWYGKFDYRTTITPFVNSSLASVTSEFQMLNQYMKEIRKFMNQLFEIVHGAMHVKKKKSQDTLHSKNEFQSEKQSQVVHLPSKVEFVEITEKIKTCLNLAAAHEQRITNPSSSEIVNQMFLFLRILGDATLNRSTGLPDLISGVKNPLINSTTVKFLHSNLSIENSKYWPILGFNYGCMRGSVPNDLHKNRIDEFEIKDLTDNVIDDRKIFQMQEPKLSKRQSKSNAFTYDDHDYPLPAIRSSYSNNRLSPIPLVNDETIHRNFSQPFETEVKKPHYSHRESLSHQPVSRSSRSNNHIHSGNSAWNDRQCRFIDAVRLRDGKLGKIICDRPPQNYRELGVSLNEVVEILQEYNDMIHIKNALGETGDCPRSVVKEIHDKHSR